MALYVIGPDFFFASSKKVGSDLFGKGIQASVDLVFPNVVYSGVGMELSWFFFPAAFNVSVYNSGGETIGQFRFAGAPGPEPITSFFGAWCDQAIGRINVYDESGPWPDTIDNIQMWQ